MIRRMRLIYIYGKDCATCRFLEPNVEKYAEKNWLELEKYEVSESPYKVDSIPTMFKVMGEEDIVNDLQSIF